MQNQYACDVGDFGKFGLLRHLRSRLHMRLGVVWYLHADESDKRDGNYREYLEPDSGYRRFDTELWEGLRRLKESKPRSVRALEESDLLGSDTLFFSDPVDCPSQYSGQTREAKDKRCQLRRAWCQRAVAAMNGARLVFLDPDNGLETKTCSQLHHQRAGKYAFYCEVSEFFQHCDVLVVYHHFSRHKNHEQQLRQGREDFMKRLKSAGDVFALRFKPYSPRAFFVATSSRFYQSVGDILNEFVGSPGWKDRWDRVMGPITE